MLLVEFCIKVEQHYYEDVMEVLEYFGIETGDIRDDGDIFGKYLTKIIDCTGSYDNLMKLCEHLNNKVNYETILSFNC